jgi:DsbC/DsbD-like thiol-disulfide interchange protein
MAAPERALEGPVMTYAYFNEVLLPVAVSRPAGISSFPIKAKASWLICEKICVPEQGELSLDLPIGAASPSAEAPLFAAADARPSVALCRRNIARRRSHRFRRRPFARVDSRSLVPAIGLGRDRRSCAAEADG